MSHASNRSEGGHTPGCMPTLGDTGPINQRAARRTRHPPVPLAWGLRGVSQHDKRSAAGRRHADADTCVPVDNSMGSSLGGWADGSRWPKSVLRRQVAALTDVVFCTLRGA